MKRFVLTSLFLTGSFIQSFSQLTIKELISTLKTKINYSEVDAFYQLNNYNLYWFYNANARNHIITLLSHADTYGLNEKDYHYTITRKFGEGKLIATHQDSIEADIMLSDAVLHFFQELQTGNKPPSFRYYGLSYTPNTVNLPLLKQFLEQDKLLEFANIIQPSSVEYSALLKKLNQFTIFIKSKNFNEVPIISNKIVNTNTPLLIRLYQLGITDSIAYAIPNAELKIRVREALQIFDVLNDGILRKTSITALNVPLSKRITELKLAISYLRWLNQIKQRGTIAIVNIPAASLLVYNYGKLILESRVIVGKSITPTPTLSSIITEVILYPYWMVPKKIAINELLPSIKRNINYLNIGNFQVINSQGQVMNPYSINWHSLSKSYFPYHIRQSTGCDNSLGIVKFNFYNPFTVYLHDTPAKSLFMLNKRYFSHGCMRVEKTVELAHLLLGRNSIAIDTLTRKGCLKHQSPVVVPVEKKIPIMVIYSTAWYNIKGAIKFYDDVYGKLN